MATFNGTEGGPIPLSTAKKWTVNYRATIKPGETEAHFFGAEFVQRVLNEGVGIRVYYAVDDSGKKQLLLVGVDGEGNNILPKEEASAASGGDEDPIIVDQALPCPPFCPKNPL